MPRLDRPTTSGPCHRSNREATHHSLSLTARRQVGLIALIAAVLLTASLQGTPIHAWMAIGQGLTTPLTPPTAALAAHGAIGSGIRTLGLGLPVRRGLQTHVQMPGRTVDTLSLPQSVDLSNDSPPVAYQGPLASCVSWVTGYYLRGWYAMRDGTYPHSGADGNGGFAPMYLFSQITGGRDVGTTFDDNLQMLKTQGIDTRTDYTQGDTDYTHGPTATQRSTAASYRIASYTTLFLGGGQGSAAQQAIEASIASGNPVSLGLPVYDNFWNADTTHYFIDVPATGSTNHGNHAVFASKYDANGLWIENQWGTGWGLNGWVELSWAFVDQYVWQAVTLTPLGTASATSTPSARPTATATVAVPTETATPILTTSTAVPQTATTTSQHGLSSPVATTTASTSTVAPTITPTPLQTTTMTPTSATTTPSTDPATRGTTRSHLAPHVAQRLAPRARPYHRRNRSAAPRRALHRYDGHPHYLTHRATSSQRHRAAVAHRKAQHQRLNRVISHYFFMWPPLTRA